MKLRELERKATPGKWQVKRCCCGHPECRDRWLSAGKFVQGSGFNEADAELIAAARNALPVLLDLLEQAKCPTCDGSGVVGIHQWTETEAGPDGEPIPVGYEQPEYCEWCAQRKEILGGEG